MGLATAAIIGLGAVSAGLSVAQGYAQSDQLKRQGQEQNRQGQYNARIYEEQAGMVGEQARIEGEQYDRAISRAFGTGMARVAGSGLNPSGSNIAKMIDTETQMQMDKAVGQYNFAVQKRYALSGANYYRDTGNQAMITANNAAKGAVFGGFTNAFTTMLSTGLSVGLMNMTPKLGIPSGWSEVGSKGQSGWAYTRVGKF
jgi:hypothetical protein